MRRSLPLPLVLVLVFVLFASKVALGGRAVADDGVTLNDNRDPAGSLRRGVLRLEVELRRADWHPLGAEQPGVPILAFAERGKRAAIPGPLVRVPAGTDVHVTVHNPLDAVLVVHGFQSRRVSELDSLIIPPRSSRQARFIADEVGTYYYWGTTTGQPVGGRAFEDSQLSGALIVDPAGREAAPSDRIFILGSYFDGKDADGEPDGTRETLVINGRPWPHTERLQYQLGDSIRWRVINPSVKVHPMHLHGFYYRVDARGDFARDTIFWPAERRMAVTERMDPGSTMTLVWSPDRPGGWLFHCHLNFHVIPNPPLGEQRDREARIRAIMVGDVQHDAHDHVQRGMGGLMLLTQVVAPAEPRAMEPARRKLRLFVQSDSVAGEPRPRFAFVLQAGDLEPARDSVHAPGSLLLLQRGEPTSIQVINRSAEPTQIHWHGIELENYYDGVVGLGGHPGMRTPPVMPGDSFEVRITPPRSGSFMYHTHVNDIRQQGLGLFGSLVVVDDRDSWNPSRDLVYLAGEGAFGPSRLFPPSADSLELTVGTRYRMRLMNVTLTGPALQYVLTSGGAPVRWTLVAKDGHDLPAAQRRRVPSVQSVTIGETFDVEFTPAFPGEYWLELRTGGGRLMGKHLLRVLGSSGS